MDAELTPIQVFKAVKANIKKVIIGQEGALNKLLAAFFTGGHVLLEDYPGTGKTTMAKALAKSIDAKFRRIQFTPDLLPSDILGVSIFDPSDGAFHFYEGPVFTNILLADEINRASPRTQSALLEAMAESQVTIDGKKRLLSRLFFVIATQNPVELRGTYPLPEAQMDRFAARFNPGYVTTEEEVDILYELMTSKDLKHRPVEELSPVVSMKDVERVMRRTADVEITRKLMTYIVEIVKGTRNNADVVLGASLRASSALLATAKAFAFFDENDFVAPDHILAAAESVIAHRLVLSNQARFSGKTEESVVREIIERIPVP